MLFLAKANKEEKMESCYNLFEKYNWDLTKFKNNTDLFIEEVRINAREYALEVLGKKLTKEQIWCLMPKNIKLLFNDYDSIIREMLKVKIISQSHLMDIDWMSNNLKNNISKFCYDICEELKWINARIDEYCVERGILPASCNGLARHYMLEVLGMNDIQQEEHRNKRLAYRKDYNFNENDSYNSIYIGLYNRLLGENDYHDIIKAFSELNTNYYAIKHALTNLIISYNLPNNIREELLGKLTIYADYLKENRKLEEAAKKTEKENKYIEGNLENARLIIAEYLNSNYSDINQYCLNANLERKVFDKYLELVKNNDEQLYTKYLQRIEDDKNKSYEDLLSRTLKVIDLIKNGVVENGVKREFDLVDYYRYLPLGFDKMLRIVRDGINHEDYKLLGAYVGKHKNDRELSEVEIDNIYNVKTLINVEFDEENKVIPGSGREITIQEKQNIVKYLIDNNIPVTNKTYNIIYRRWLSGELVLETEKDKVK